MKGLGPEWTDAHAHVYLDDLDPGLSDMEINDMARAEAEADIRKRGYLKFYITHSVRD